MVWTAFEIAINCVQGLLTLMFVKQCFAYEKQHPVADAALVLSCAGLLTFLLSRHMLFVDQILYVFPAIYALTLSSERKTSIVYWLIVMTLLFNMISVVTYPIFELLPQITHMPFPSVQAKRFVSIIVTNIALFAVLKLLILIKKGCSVPGTSSYAAFMITLSAAFLVEESLYSLFLNVSDETIVPFFWAYIGLIVFTMMTVLLFRMVSMDADRKNRYQTEIAMLSLTRQHQQELSQMYEDLTQRQHDYKHHLQTLQELVTGSGESTAKAYLETVLKDTRRRGYDRHRQSGRGRAAGRQAPAHEREGDCVSVFPVSAGGAAPPDSRLLFHRWQPARQCHRGRSAHARPPAQSDHPPDLLPLVEHVLHLL